VGFTVAANPYGQRAITVVREEVQEMFAPASRSMPGSVDEEQPRRVGVTKLGAVNERTASARDHEIARARGQLAGDRAIDASKLSSESRSYHDRKRNQGKHHSQAVSAD
jgi:hypothetical protein